MFTMSALEPWRKKAKIGSEADRTLPDVEVLVIGRATPRRTIQLQRMPLMKAVSHPAAFSDPADRRYPLPQRIEVRVRFG
jgi:hypothetical protein